MLYFGTTGGKGPVSTRAIANAAPSDYALFQTALQGHWLKAVLPLAGVAPGTPLVAVLYFCETYFSAPGSRLFQWAFNGGPAALPTPFDIVANASAPFTATSVAFRARTRAWMRRPLALFSSWL